MNLKYLILSASLMLWSGAAMAGPDTLPPFPVHDITSSLRVNAHTCGPAGRADPKTLSEIKSGHLMPLRYFPACRAVEFFDPDDHDRRVVMLVENLVLPKGKEPGAKRWRRLLDIPESDPAFCLFEASEPNKMALGGGGAMGFGEANSCAKNASNEH